MKLIGFGEAIDDIGEFHSEDFMKRTIRSAYFKRKASDYRLLAKENEGVRLEANVKQPFENA